VIIERIPFEEAIGEPLLLKGAFDELSKPIQVALKVIYGLPLSAEELPYWAMFQGKAEYDHLGYPVSFGDHLYEPREYEDATIILGRRSHKTGGISAFVLGYEALLGGHSKRVGKKQKGRLFLVDQSLEHAEQHLQEFVEPVISSSPLLAKEISKVNTDGIFLKNRLAILPGYPNIKIFRGYAIPVVVMDEAGFYYKDKESANPDYEVVRSVEPSMGQFEHRKKLTVSTPWSKEGILWDGFNAGTQGEKLSDPEERKKYKDTVVLHAPTPAMENPLLDRKWFEKQYLKDPDAYVREILARFVDSISGLIPESLLRQAVVDAPKVREALPRKDHPDDPSPFYVAAMDPAFRHDQFAFTIVHWDNGLVQDYLQVWKPSPKVKLVPTEILDEIAPVLQQYRITTVYSDQYQLESLQQLALARGFVIIGIDFTRTSKAKIYGSFITLLKQGQVHLLHNHEQFQELLDLEKKVLPGGTVSISAPLGKFDDIATSLVLATSQCHFIAPYEGKKKEELSPHEKIMKQIARMRRAKQAEQYG
jgi:hypothetical protein